MKKILLVFGTRPEAIKMAPLVMAFQQNTSSFQTFVCVTAQHRQMLDQVLDFFEITPDFDLNLMKPDQTLFSITADVLNSLKSIFNTIKPDYVFVHGDTTTSMAAALAAYYSGIKVAHVEAGLRTYNKWAPFPEEMNRQLTSRLADLHLAPTEFSKMNLLNEGISADNILVTGNTVIDALLYSSNKVNSPNYVNEEINKLKTDIDSSRNIILVTGHRRENLGSGLENICEALKVISEKTNTQIIYPVHLNPSVQKTVYESLNGTKNIKLIPPLSYPSFVWLMGKSKLIISDSGGVQEEAPSLGKPVLVTRDVTERPEAIEAGTIVLVGTNKNMIIDEALDLLTNKDRYNHMSSLQNPYGDGNSCIKIVEYLKRK